MTNRQKIEYLQQYEVLIGDVRDRKLMIEYWEGQKEGLGSAPIGDGPHGCGKSDIVEIAIQSIDEMVQKYSEDVVRLSVLAISIESAIDGACKNRKEQRVMRLRYIHLLKFPEISKKMRLSERQVLRIHKDALDRIGVPQK